MYVDNTQMHAIGSLVRVLLDTNTDVFVHQERSYMLHEKLLLVDDDVVVHELVNWTYHALIRGGLAVIQDDQRLVSAVVRYFTLMVQGGM